MPYDPADDLDRPDVLTEPSAQTVRRDYSDKLILPIALVTSVFLHVLVVAALMLVIYLSFQGGADKTSVPISLVTGGEDDSGLGSAGSGNVADPVAQGDTKPSAFDPQFQPLPDKQLPEINEKLKEFIPDDPNATVAISPERAASMLDDDLKRKLDQAGDHKGDGVGGGKGNTGQAGPGVGGTGADATRARSLRWVLRFKTNSGRDYLDQLMALGADVVVPIPPDNKSAHVYRSAELASPKGELMTDGQWTKLAKQVQFCDYKPESVRQVSAALGVHDHPSCFWAFFPKSLEAEMARKETEHQGKRPEDIDETVFAVKPVNGTFVLEVVRQTLKR